MSDPAEGLEPLSDEAKWFLAGNTDHRLTLRNDRSGAYYECDFCYSVFEGPFPRSSECPAIEPKSIISSLTAQVEKLQRERDAARADYRRHRELTSCGMCAEGIDLAAAEAALTTTREALERIAAGDGSPSEIAITALSAIEEKK